MNIFVYSHVGLFVEGLVKGIHGLGGGEGVVTGKKKIYSKNITLNKFN